MIRLSCTSCSQFLEIDDAFAGGVCRCQYCGAIQTVPKHLKTGAGAGSRTPGNGNGQPKAAKTLYQVPVGGRTPGDSSAGLSGSGLSSSGLSRGSLARSRIVSSPPGDAVAPPKRAADPQSPPAPPSKNHRMLALTIGVCAAAIALGIVLIIILSTHSSQAGPGARP
jgi:hypothetical protein